MDKGFTIIELVVVIAITAVLSGIILFSVTQYISRGKDANVSGSLAILIPAGEVFYNNNGNSYNKEGVSFCTSPVVANIASQAPANPSTICYDENSNPTGACCGAISQAWAACAREFTNPNLAFCVDSRGMKKEICYNHCVGDITICPDGEDITHCPD
ncbi:MAG: prepilin-type N-terminal cleavage/methylation domain-containing protein [Candidatus Staskawiczbacteria bacterium]|nr:prepilin-type N-terminal cleavage/methylation domain-containing protein [Candidatus Staskawiczbacteria bacterium]